MMRALNSELHHLIRNRPMKIQLEVGTNFYYCPSFTEFYYYLFFFFFTKEAGEKRRRSNSHKEAAKDGGEQPTEEMVERMDERLEAAQSDQKNLFLIVFQV
jgi:hypothetical protein